MRAYLLYVSETHGATTQYCDVNMSFYKSFLEVFNILVAVFLQHIRAIAPILLHLDVGRQKDFRAEEFFHVLTGVGRNLFNRFALLADEYRLVVLSFADDVEIDFVDAVFVTLELVDDDCDAVGDLLVEFE